MQKTIKKELTNSYEKIAIILAPLFLTISTILVYYPSLNYPFQFDDGPNILKFFNIRNLTFESLAFTRSRWIVTWLDTILYKIGKFEPFFYRCVNIGIHLLTGIFLFYVLYFALSGLIKKSFFKDNAFLISFVSSLFFLLHPVQTQTISYVIQGQSEGLATLFVVSMILCFLAFSKTNNLFAKSFLTILLLCLTILSTGTKEISIVAPILIMLIDWFFIAQGNFASYKKRMPIHFLILCTSLGFFIYYLKPKFFINLFSLNMSTSNNIGNIITENPQTKITPILFLISQFKVILHYLLIFIWPFNISVDYDWKINNSFWDMDSFIPFLILCMIFSFIIYLLRKDKTNLFAFGLIWFFIAILPRSSVIPSTELLADYKTYLASVGWLLIIAAFITKIYLRLTTIKPKVYVPIALCVMLCTSLCTMTYQRNKVWRTSLEFWENVIKTAPTARAHNNYAIELTKEGKYQEAVVYFKKAIQTDPYNYCDAYTNLAATYAILGKVDLAIETLEKSLSINRFQPEAYNNLGTFFLYKGEFDKAQKCFDAALALVPHYGKAMLNYGRLYLAQNDSEAALQWFEKACTKSDFDQSPECFEFFANTSMNLKKYDDAITGFNRVLELTKDNKQAKDALFNLGNAHYLKQDLDEAAKVFYRMTRQFPKDPHGWCNLIETLINLSEFKSALDSITQAQNLGVFFEGIAIQRARCLANLGHVNLARKILQEVSSLEKSPKMRSMALQMLNNLENLG